MIEQKLGPYNIIEEIGKGGMATVFRAHQPSIDRDVAVKLIRARIADDPTAIQRFQREARLIARLEHPHILPVYDFDGSHDPPYIVMRYLEGGTLKEVMAQGKLPLPEVTYLLRQVCSAMDYAHRQGIVHRDLKPSNILIDREGNAFVMDFGIARMAADMGGRQITETGAIVGTPDYMAPEQIQGSASVDQRADVYSLGIIAYEMLSDDFPFPKVDAMAMMYHHMNEIPASICEKAPDLPDVVEDVMDRVLEKDPELRYSSAAEFAEALTKAIGGTISSSPVTLRAAAGTSIIKRVGGSRNGATDSHSTPSEQNKSVTALYADAGEYSLLIEESNGTQAARRAMEVLWKSFERLITDYDGQVFLRTDTDILAIWGADATHEDDAERAIRTALTMQETLNELGAAFLADDDEPLPLNIGINSGMVLLIPSGDTSSYTATGTTITVTNRLMQNAYGTVLITHETYRQVMGIFDMQEDVPLRIRGRKGTIDTYRVDAAKARAFHIQLRGIEGIETQMVGRDSELKHLQKAFMYAFEYSEPQVVTIASDAGLGKSRLLYEFGKWGELREETYRLFRGRASTAMRERPYALMRDMMSFRFNIQDSDSPDIVQEKLEGGVAEIIQRDDTEMAHMIGQLCGFDLSHSPHIKGLLGDAQQLTNRAKQLFIRFFVQLAGDIQPVVVELEDIHHADDASLDLLNELFVASEEMQLLVICNTRSVLFERRPEWGSGQQFHTRLELKPLDKFDSLDLMRELLQKVAKVPKALRDLLVDRAEGNPFYMEELVKMLIDDRVILRESDDVWSVEESRLGALNVPTTLNGLLAARIDTLLYPEKLTLQRAVVVGRIFYDTALEAIDAADENHVNNLQSILETLAEREFIHRRETTAFANSTEYIFASNMLHDAIENALLEQQIQNYSRATAEWLANISGDRVDEYYAQIAEFYEQAQEAILAATYLAHAAKKAEDGGLYHSARRLYRHALTLTPENHDNYAIAQLNLGRVLSMGESLAEAKSLVETALEAFRERGDNYHIARALHDLARIISDMGDRETSQTMLTEALPLAQTENDLETIARVYAAWAGDAAFTGNLETARELAPKAIEAAEKFGSSHLKLGSLNLLAIIAFMDGDLDAALEHLQELYRQAKQHGNRGLQSLAIGNIAEVHVVREEWEKAQAPAEEASKLDTELGRETVNSTLRIAKIYFALDDPRAQETLYQGMSIAWGNQRTIYLLEGLMIRAEMYFKVGEQDTGLALLGLAMYHPNADEETRQYIERIIQRYNIPEDVAAAGMEAGKELDFEATVQEILEELKT